MAKTLGKVSPKVTNWLVVVYFSFQYGATYTKSGDIRCCLPNMMTRLHKTSMPKRIDLVFSWHAMDNHTLSTCLGIKLFKIDTNEMYSTLILSSKNTIINGFVLFGNKSQDECTILCYKQFYFLHFFFLPPKWPIYLIFLFTYAHMLLSEQDTHHHIYTLGPFSEVIQYLSFNKVFYTFPPKPYTITITFFLITQQSSRIIKFILWPPEI